MLSKIDAALTYMILGQALSSITGNQSLLSWALFGAIGGGLCAAAALPTKNDSTNKQRMERWFVSAFLGFAATSPILGFFKVPLETDHVFATSAFISFFGWTIVLAVQKELPETLVSILKSIPEIIKARYSK